MAPETTTNVDKAPCPVVLERDGMRMLRIEIPLSGYTSEDIVVRPLDARLMILNKSDELLTSVDLPETVDPFEVEAEMTEEGLLWVEAPMAC